jgi:hypothetical protein
MTAVLMAAATAACFGVANFAGGLASRRDAALAVTANAHLLGAALLVAGLLLFPARDATLTDVAWGGLAGVTGGLAVVALYAALAFGRMSVVAPLTAAISAALPAIYDVASGTVLQPLTGLGIALALVAVLVVSLAGDTESRAAMPLKAVLLAVAAGVGFSVTLIAYSFSGADSGLVPLVSARVVSTTLLGAMTLVRFRRYLVVPEARLFAFGSGVVDAIANVTAHHGAADRAARYRLGAERHASRGDDPARPRVSRRATPGGAACRRSTRARSRSDDGAVLIRGGLLCCTSRFPVQVGSHSSTSYST